MANFSKKLGTMEFDGLVTDIVPKAEVRGKTIRKLQTAGTLKRGTILAKSSVDDKLVILGSTAASASQKFSGDASAKVFVVTAKPSKITSVKIGTTASTDWVYDASTGKITFGTAPASGTNNIEATYISEELIPDCILCDDTSVGTTSDVNAPVYTAGCFDDTKMFVAENYTLSEADYDNLRKNNIVFKSALAEN